MKAQANLRVESINPGITVWDNKDTISAIPVHADAIGQVNTIRSVEFRAPRGTVRTGQTVTVTIEMDE